MSPPFSNEKAVLEIIMVLRKTYAALKRDIKQTGFVQYIVARGCGEGGGGEGREGKGGGRARLIALLIGSFVFDYQCAPIYYTEKWRGYTQRERNTPQHARYGRNSGEGTIARATASRWGLTSAPI